MLEIPFQGISIFILFCVLLKRPVTWSWKNKQTNKSKQNKTKKMRSVFKSQMSVLVFSRGLLGKLVVKIILSKIQQKKEKK